MANRARHWLLRGVGMLTLLALLAAGGAWAFLAASLPQLDGTRVVHGLHGRVTVTRDAYGVPTVSADDRGDVAYATGFLHAQDRFFQMDLLRRTAAGELAALIGPAAVPLDRAHRLFRFRAHAEAALAHASPADRVLLDRYVAGVNDGLAALGARPFEYALLGQRPTPWRAEDTLLVIWAMYFDLQGDLDRKLARGWLQERTTPAQLAFLLPQSSRYDAPLDADRIDVPPANIPAAAPDWIGATRHPLMAMAPSQSNVGSNNYVVSGSRTRDGQPIVGDDMHLDLRLPNTWYRMAMRFRDAHGDERQLIGVTLPGAPAVVVGSNGHVAWAFTNSYGDYTDLVELDGDPHDPMRFHTAGGSIPIVRHDERIDVRGQAPEWLTVLDSPLGPVEAVGDKHYAVHWIASEPGAVNLRLIDLESADDLASLQAVANRAGIPAQNIVAADAAGHIGWTIAGPLPARQWQWAASFPYPASDTALGWTGLRAPADYPRIIDPPGGVLATANARQLVGPAFAAIGDGGDDLGARVSQLRGDLRTLDKPDEHAVFDVTLDDRALFMTAWRARALKALDPASLQGHPLRARYRDLLAHGWDGRADAGSVGYRLARAYETSLYQQVFGAADDAMTQTLHQRLGYSAATGRWAAVLGRVDDAAPSGWVPRGLADWHAVELAAIDQAAARLTAGGKPLRDATWGARNTARIVHPFALFMPWLGRWLGAPTDALPGDDDMPRVAAPSFGQSERIVVSPGHEERGLFDMPGGESGNPLSRYFLAGHEAWVHGRALPLLPGPAQHTLVFAPAAS